METKFKFSIGDRVRLKLFNLCPDRVYKVLSRKYTSDYYELEKGESDNIYVIENVDTGFQRYEREGSLTKV